MIFAHRDITVQSDPRIPWDVLPVATKMLKEKPSVEVAQKATSAQVIHHLTHRTSVPREVTARQTQHTVNNTSAIPGHLTLYPVRNPSRHVNYALVGSIVKETVWINLPGIVQVVGTV